MKKSRRWLLAFHWSWKNRPDRAMLRAGYYRPSWSVIRMFRHERGMLIRARREGPVSEIPRPIIPAPIFLPYLLTEAPRCQYDGVGNESEGEGLPEAVYWGPPLPLRPPLSEWMLPGPGEDVWQAWKFREGVPQEFLMSRFDAYALHLAKVRAGGGA